MTVNELIEEFRIMKDCEITNTKMLWQPVIEPMTYRDIIREGDPIQEIEHKRIELFVAIDKEQLNPQESV